MDSTKKACIIIPLYQAELSPYEQIAVEQCFHVLGKYDIFFVIPRRLEAHTAALAEVRSGKAAYKTFPDPFFADIPGYNRLLKAPDFYAAFLAYEFMLLYQTDAFVFKDELMQWCARGYDHIGAPLFEGHDLAGPGSRLTGQGNGGFCLKQVQHCYNVVTTFRKLKFKKEYTDANAPGLRKVYRYLKHHHIYNYSCYPFQPIINEDLFWAREVPKVFAGFRVPTPEEATGFSFEVNPEVLYQLNHQQLPFGCHAWWRYDFGFWKKHIESYGYAL